MTGFTRLLATARNCADEPRQSCLPLQPGRHAGFCSRSFPTPYSPISGVVPTAKLSAATITARADRVAPLATKATTHVPSHQEPGVNARTQHPHGDSTTPRHRRETQCAPPIKPWQAPAASARPTPLCSKGSLPTCPQRLTGGSGEATISCGRGVSGWAAFLCVAGSAATVGAVSVHRCRQL